VNFKDRTIKKLQKENAKLSNNIVINDIIATKPIKMVKATPTTDLNKRRTKTTIINRVINNLYGVELNTDKKQLFNNLMNINPNMYVHIYMSIYNIYINICIYIYIYIYI